MRIILFGGSGQIGFELNCSLGMIGDIFSPDRYALDLYDKNSVNEYLAQIEPDLIINAAAWTDVDAAEKNQSLASRLNIDLVSQLADYSYKNSVWFIHYSSDYVFNGTGDTPWKEDDVTAPINFYGKTKEEGEKAIQKICSKYIIFRTSWVYSARRKNFMKTILKLAVTGNSLSIVTDQIGSPTPARLIAEITLLAIRKRLEAGIYNLATTGKTSWHGFAEAILDILITKKIMSNADNIKILPILTKDYFSQAIRPLNSQLDVTKLEDALNIRLPSWESQLNLFCNEYLESKLLRGN